MQAVLAFFTGFYEGNTQFRLGKCSFQGLFSSRKHPLAFLRPLFKARAEDRNAYSRAPLHSFRASCALGKRSPFADSGTHVAKT